jgi:hypothetical protein
MLCEQRENKVPPVLSNEWQTICLSMCLVSPNAHQLTLPSSPASNQYLPPHNQYYSAPHVNHSHTHVVSPPPRPETTQRKRPKYTRSKTGCMTCRVKKIKVGCKNAFSVSDHLCEFFSTSATRQSRTACGARMVRETYGHSERPTSSLFTNFPFPPNSVPGLKECPHGRSPS